MKLTQCRGGEVMTGFLGKWFSRTDNDTEEVEIGVDMVPAFGTLDARYAEMDRLAVRSSSSKQGSSPFTTTVSGPVRASEG